MKKIVIFILLLALFGAAIGFYLYTKKPADINDLKEDFSLTAVELSSAFIDDETVATQKFANKVILVFGKITEIKTDSQNPSVQLEGSDLLTGITCSLYADELSKTQNLKTGDKITIKGKCTGKLMDVVLNNCRIYQTKK
jgi:hypothetical protein